MEGGRGDGEGRGIRCSRGDRGGGALLLRNRLGLFARGLGLVMHRAKSADEKRWEQGGGGQAEELCSGRTSSHARPSFKQIGFSKNLGPEGAPCGARVRNNFL